MPIKFRFSWTVLFATLVVVAIGVAAGQWQTRRGDRKEAIEARMQQRSAEPVIELNGSADVQADAVEFRHVRATGEFVRDWPVYLDNRPYQGRAGFYLLMPFKISGTGRAVLVARGWFPRDVHDRAKLPAIATPAGTIEVEGEARRTMGRLFQLGSPPPLRAGAIVQNAEIADVAAASRLQLLPILIAQTNDAHDGLVRDWPRPSSGVAMHRGYAMQWYGLAATALAFFVITGFRRGRQQQ
jgi:cytochrome oxidase assembly protein ShyY1